MFLTHEDIDDLIDLLEDAHLDELRLRTKQYSLALIRDHTEGWTREYEVTAPPTLVAGGVQTRAAAGTTAIAEEPASEGHHDVRCPLPGTFYRAAKPGDPPFVEIGDVVEAHTVVGIVETMKMFNSISAGVDGIVRGIYLENGELAHHDTLLMRIETVEP